MPRTSTACSPRYSSALDDYAYYIHQRRAEELTDAGRLHAELQTYGRRGSLRTVQRYLRPLCTPCRPSTGSSTRRRNARSEEAAVSF
jgi:hypothetical protein